MVEEGKTEREKCFGVRCIMLNSVPQNMDPNLQTLLRRAGLFMGLNMGNIFKNASILQGGIYEDLGFVDLQYCPLIF